MSGCEYSPVIRIECYVVVNARGERGSLTIEIQLDQFLLLKRYIIELQDVVKQQLTSIYIEAHLNGIISDVCNYDAIIHA